MVEWGKDGQLVIHFEKLNEVVRIDEASGDAADTDVPKYDDDETLLRQLAAERAMERASERRTERLSDGVSSDERRTERILRTSKSEPDYNCTCRSRKTVSSFFAPRSIA
jgi:hypothetical protein